MRIFFLIHIFLALCFCSIAQSSVELSAVPKHLIPTCENVVDNFIKAYNQQTDLTPYLTPNEANFNGQLWLPLDQFTSFLGNFLNKPINEYNFSYYNIDDIEKNDHLKKKAIKLGLAFNNYSMLANGLIDGKSSTIVLNVQGDEMRIYSIGLLDVPIMHNNKQEVTPTDTVEHLKIALKIPQNFGEPTKDNNFLSYVSPGRTGRDQNIQIINNDKQAELSLITYQWADYVTSKYKRSDFDIGYVPNGYIYQYEILDEEKRVNKGITVGLEHNDQIILIQYFGFKEAYYENWQQIDQMMRNIKKL